MKKNFLLLSVGFALAACSTPRYTYNFDHYDYQSGKKKEVEKSGFQEFTLDESPLKMREHDLVASASSYGVASENEGASLATSLQMKAEVYKSMARDQRKVFRKELRKEIKNYAKELSLGNRGASIMATKELDDELKLAIIFGAIGITLTLLGGINTIFWVLGVVGLVIGLVFFIRWIQTQ